MTDKPHGLTGKKNAKKDETAESWLQVRTLTSDKSLWVKAAQKSGGNLSGWVTKTLNDVAKKELNIKE
ncbi:hypothetical protein DTO96_102440 [Ephemeroptericola cinctiostellae]|uniref:Uncharacterized protein n=1 Tax=Ephemeroptericola cinctiostellae TaxID=2268024 RepID=A0A345DE97_9BURK|nr:hypothetical protein [Ephemeroptericola cinctiostellae]AXF86685.1 hypothetical protein DTO96_102440 [Ephemeroptericola cinctiostellae]